LSRSETVVAYGLTITSIRFFADPGTAVDRPADSAGSAGAAVSGFAVGVSVVGVALATVGS
jgi:hypothetical protein